MPSTVLLVGTRKGCFVLESDEGRSDWQIRGPYCEGWPIYHAVHDPASGAFYAAAASEWHGAGVWRSDDLGETWELSSEGLDYADGGTEALEDLRPRRGPRAPACGRRVGGRLREPRRRRHVVAAQHARRPAGPHRLERPGEPASRTPRPAGDPAAPRRSVPPLRRRAGDRHLRDRGRRRVLDAAQQRPARRLAARGARGRLLRPQARDVAGRPRSPLPAEPLRHASQRRRRAGRGSRSPRACRPTSASPRRRTRTTARAST